MNNMKLQEKNLVYNIYDDNSCNVIKLSFLFFIKEAECIVKKGNETLNILLLNECITKKSFDLRYIIFQYAVKSVYKLVVYNLKKIKNINSKFLDYNCTCFSNSYYKSAISSIIFISLSYLSKLADIENRLPIKYISEECVARFLIKELEDILQNICLKCFNKYCRNNSQIE